MMMDALGGHFSKEARERLNKHLSTCESCRKEFEAFSGAWEMLATIKDIEPSTGFVSRLHDKIEKKNAKPFFSLFPAKAAVVAIVLSLAIVFFTNSGEKEMETIDTAMLEYDLEMIENIELLMVIEDMDELDLIENI